MTTHDEYPGDIHTPGVDWTCPSCEQGSNDFWDYACGWCEGSPPLRKTPGGYVIGWTPAGGIPTVVKNMADLAPNAPEADPVNQPAHYTHSAVEVIDAIDAWGLGFCLGNVVKYVARHEHKGTPRRDLEKARWYLDRALAAMDGAAQ